MSTKPDIATVRRFPAHRSLVAGEFVAMRTDGKVDLLVVTPGEAIGVVLEMHDATGEVDIVMRPTVTTVEFMIPVDLTQADEGDVDRLGELLDELEETTR